jgi:cell division septation protein DedD
MAGSNSSGRGPSPSADARRRGQAAPPPRRRYQDEEDAPWLDEADYEDDEGPTHTLVGRRTLFGLLALIAILTIGVVVGITLVSGREDAPIDVPAVGEEIPVLASPGPWKRPPSGPDVDGIPVEGQGQVIYGTGVGQETEATIDTSALPEDPLPRPGTEVEVLPAVDEALETDARIATPPPAPAVRPAPAAPKPPKPVDTVMPKEVRAAPAQPKVVAAPPPAQAASGGGSVLQLGAFSSQARARAAFKSLTDRYSYLEGMEPMIVPVESDGKTLYRLRSQAAGSAAARDICGRLRVAGEPCAVVN